MPLSLIFESTLCSAGASSYSLLLAKKAPSSVQKCSAEAGSNSLVLVWKGELTNEGLQHCSTDFALPDLVLPDAQPHYQRDEHQAGANNEGRPCTVPFTLGCSSGCAALHALTPQLLYDSSPSALAFTVPSPHFPDELRGEGRPMYRQARYS